MIELAFLQLSQCAKFEVEMEGYLKELGYGA